MLCQLLILALVLPLQCTLVHPHMVLHSLMEHHCLHMISLSLEAQDTIMIITAAFLSEALMGRFISLPHHLIQVDPCWGQVFFPLLLP